MREASLSRIEIHSGDALNGLHQRDRNMHCNRGFARPALFIAHNDHMGGPRSIVLSADMRAYENPFEVLFCLIPLAPIL